MEQVSVESIYRDIVLLPNIERDKLYNRMKKDFYRDNETVAYTTAGKLLTKSEYLAQINIGLQQIEDGDVITDEELQKEIATW